MCNKAVNTYPSAIRFVPEYYKTQEIGNKVVHTCFSVFNSIADQYEKHVTELFLKILFF